MSSQTTLFNETTVTISVDEYKHLKDCENELFNVKELIGEILRGN